MTGRSRWTRSGSAPLLAGFALPIQTAGFFTRLIETDAWTMLFWRGLFGGLFLFGMVAWQRTRPRSWPASSPSAVTALLVAFCSALATVCFLNALRFTRWPTCW